MKANYDDMFSTDWSKLDAVIEEAAPAASKTSGSAKKSLKTLDIAGINFTRGISGEIRAKMSASAKRRRATAQTRFSIQQAKFRPIMTPSGSFPSKTAAVEWAQARGLVNAYNKITKWLKTHPELFYYLPKDTK